MDVDIEYRVPSTPSTDDETQQAKHKNEVVALEAKISFLEQELTRRDRGALIGSFHIHHREPGRYFRGVDTFEYLEYYQQINILWVFVEMTAESSGRGCDTLLFSRRMRRVRNMRGSNVS